MPIIPSGMLLGGGGGGQEQAPSAPPPAVPDVPETLRGRDRSNLIGLGTEQLGLLSELLSSVGALDAFFQNIAARNDPTIPALLNSQFQRFANMQNTGGFDANAFLGGDFSTPAPANPITLGAGGGSPFDIPLQEAGGVNPIIQSLLDNALTPGFFDQISGLSDMLFQFGSPLSVVSGGGGVLRSDPESNVGVGGDFQDLLDQIQGLFGGGAQGAQGAQGGQEAAPPVLGSFAHGGVVPQTGLFQLEQGETVLPTGPQAAPLSFSAPGLPTPQGATLNKGQQYGNNAFDPLPPTTPIEPSTQIATQPEPAPASGAGPGQLNPLQQAIQSLLQMVQGGGPLQQNINDQFSQQLQSSRRNVAENFGSRGLGGSGVEEALQLQSELGIQGNAIRESNALGLQSAQALGGLSLGAGQFGLQQQALQNQASNDLLQLITQIFQGTFAPGENPVQTVNVI